MNKSLLCLVLCRFVVGVVSQCGQEISVEITYAGAVVDQINPSTGTFIQLTCYVSGQSGNVIAYSWTKNGNTESQTGLHYSIVGVSATDGGIYQCEAELDCGTVSSNTLTISTEPMIVAAPPNQVVEEGESFQLTCSAEGWPNPSYKWQFGSETLTHTEGIYIKPTAALSDEGEYTCLAGNIRGNDVSYFFLSVNALPSPTLSDVSAAPPPTIQEAPPTSTSSYEAESSSMTTIPEGTPTASPTQTGTAAPTTSADGSSSLSGPPLVILVFSIMLFLGLALVICCLSIYTIKELVRQKKTRKRSNKNDIEEIELVSDPVHSDADALGPQDTPEQQEEAGTRTSTLIVNEAFENGSDLPDGDAAESEAKPKKQEVSVSTASPSTGDLALMEGSPQQKETKKSVEKAKKNKNKKEKDKKDNKDIKKEKKEKKEKKGVASSDRDTALLLAEEGGEEVKDATSSPLATAVENVVEQGGRGDKQQKQVAVGGGGDYTLLDFSQEEGEGTEAAMEGGGGGGGGMHSSWKTPQGSEDEGEGEGEGVGEGREGEGEKPGEVEKQVSHSSEESLLRSNPLSLAKILTILNKVDSSLLAGKKSHVLAREFASVPFNSVKQLPLSPAENSKNRYRNVLPNENSMVKLTSTGEDGSTYINANYMRGYKNADKKYISTQGPIPETVADFWRLVWEQNISVIVMLTGLVENGMGKCARYWPTADSTEPAKYGNMVIRNNFEEVTPVYKITYLTVYLNGSEEEDMEEEREIIHYWFTAWPDFGVPKETSSLMSLRNAVRSSSAEAGVPSPILVHCSAGLGRSGVFMATDIAIEQYEAEKEVDPLKILCDLREDRGGAIQTVDQYVFVHRVMANFMASK